MITSGNEQRNFRRMNVQADVMIKSEQATLYGRSRDLSATGVSVLLEQSHLRVNDTVRLQIDSSGGRTPPLIAEATVLRVAEEDGQVLVAFSMTVVA